MINVIIGIGSIAFVLIASMAFAGDITIKVGGKDVVLKHTSINHEIKKSDIDKGGWDSAVECSFLFYSLLAKGDIQEASTLATDPTKTADIWTNYRERLGMDDFKKEMQGYFTSGNVILAELVLGEDTMLVIKTEDGTIGQLYQKKDAKYFMTGMPFSDAAKTLGKVLTMIQDGKIKL